jgi:hypothetical protein
MMQAGPFARIALVLRDGDTDVMRAAYRDFEPAVPVTQEGVLSAAAGFVGLWGGTLLVAGFLRSLFRRRQRHLPRRESLRAVGAPGQPDVEA